MAQRYWRFMLIFCETIRLIFRQIIINVFFGCCNNLQFFLYSNNRMNLSPDQYLNMIDQMTVLRIQNQRFERDKTILADQLHRQNMKIQQLSQPNNKIISTTNPGSRMGTEYEKTSSDIRKWNKTAEDYVEQFKSSIESMQNKICQFINMSRTEQMNEIKKQLIKLKEEFHPISKQVEINKQNKQNILLKQNKQIKESRQSVRNNQISSPSHGEKPSEREKKVQEFYKKVKFIYGLWNKQKKQPNIQDLYAWVNKINVQLQNPGFNPIQAVKKARTEKKIINFNKLEKGNHKKDEEKNFNTSFDSQHRKKTEDYIENYVSPNKKKEAKNSNQSTKKSNFYDEGQQNSTLEPKIPKTPKKQGQSKKKQVKKQQGLKKRPIILHKQMMNKLNQQRKQKRQENKTEDKQKGKSTGTKTIIPSESHKSIKDKVKKDSKSSQNVPKRKNSESGINKGSQKLKQQKQRAGKQGSKSKIEKKSSSTNHKVKGTNKQIQDKKTRSNPKGSTASIKDDKHQKNKKDKDKQVSNTIKSLGKGKKSETSIKKSKQGNKRDSTKK